MAVILTDDCTILIFFSDELQTWDIS